MFDLDTLTLHTTQSDMFTHADKHNHQFFFSMDKPSSSSGAKIFSSCPDLHTFLHAYAQIPFDQRHCYELMRENHPVFEYYDLDVKIPACDTDTDTDTTNLYTNTSLFMWFDATRSQFIKHIAPVHATHISPTHHQLIHTLSKPNWIILTASDHTKLSLHLINTNAIFTSHEHLRGYTNAFKTWNTSFQPANVPFDIDFSVYFKNRAMRIIHSTKLGSNRRLTLWDEFHTDPVPLHQTFITAAKLVTNPTHRQIDWSILSATPPAIPPAQSTPANLPRGRSTHLTTPSISQDAPITSLLDLLNPSRCDTYSDWLTVGMALKASGYEFDTWDTWSRLSHKYDRVACEKTWNGFKTAHTNPVTLGTIHYMVKCDNPDAYSQFISQHTHVKINLPFTPDVTIHERYIPASLYLTHLATHDVICLKSNLNSGKTHGIPAVFPIHKRIIVIYHRISLNQALHEKWKHEGFHLYSEIKEPVIKMDVYKRVIICADSLHRLRGAVDLLILDELESLHEHICGSSLLKNKGAVFYTLKDYIDHTPKIITCDGCLKDNTCDTLFKSKLERGAKMVKVENDYQVFTDKRMTIFKDKHFAIHTLLSLVDQGKRIVVPTNSKTCGNELVQLIKQSHPDLHILQIDSDHAFQSVTTWDQYSILVYTPTVTAGVSFDKLHYDHIFAFFVNTSTNAESSFQMLFRARQTHQADMYMWCKDDTKKSSPLTDTQIANHLDEIIAAGHRHLDDTGLYIDRFNSFAKRNTYYNWYMEHIRKQNLTTDFLKSYLVQLLKSHGVKIHIAHKKLEPDATQQLRSQLEIIEDIAETTHAQSLCEARDLTPTEYVKLTNRKERPTDDRLAIKKYAFQEAFKLKRSLTTSPEDIQFVEKNSKLVRQAKNFHEFAPYPIDQALQIASDNKEDRFYTQSRASSSNCYEHTKHDSETDSDSDFDLDDNKKSDWSNMNPMQQQKRMWQVGTRHKRAVAAHIPHSIHYSKTYFKVEHALHFVKLAGFTSLKCENKVKLDYEAWFHYIKKNETHIRAVFSTDKKILKPFELPDEYHDGLKRSIGKYVSSKVRSTLGVEFMSTSNKNLYYTLKCVFDVVE